MKKTLSVIIAGLLAVYAVAYISINLPHERLERKAIKFRKNIAAENIVTTFSNREEYRIFYIATDTLIKDNNTALWDYEVDTAYLHYLIKYDVKKEKADTLTMLKRTDDVKTNDVFIHWPIFKKVCEYCGIYCIENDILINPYNSFRHNPTITFSAEDKNKIVLQVETSAPFKYDAFFGPLSIIQHFDKKGNCVEHYIQDWSANRIYDYYKFNNDKDYICNLIDENISNYIETELSVLYAENIVEEFKSNSINAENQYSNQNITIRGKIMNISKEAGGFTIKLFSESPWEIICHTNDENIISKLNTNDNIILKGRFNHYDDKYGKYELHLYDCNNDIESSYLDFIRKEHNRYDFSIRNKYN